MNAFLIGISWCDPQEIAAYKRLGLVDLPSSSTGIFIQAESVEAALSWANVIANKYMRFLFHEKAYPPGAFDVFCWAEDEPEQSSWKHCLGFFPRISIGQDPEFHQMTTEAYIEWCKKMGIP
jgi:hypothetical protein